MSTGASGADRGQIPFISLLPFLLIAFGLAWGILALFIFLSDQMTEIFGELTGQHPLFFLAVYAPAIAAFSVIMHYGGELMEEFDYQPEHAAFLGPMLTNSVRQPHLAYVKK